MARAIGQAFQIADDLLDVESDAATLGKAAGKDAAAGKATLVSALGVAGAHARLDALVAEADAALAPFGAKADTLRAAARFIAERRKLSGRTRQRHMAEDNRRRAPPAAFRSASSARGRGCSSPP